jgi:tRNA threonylcarbamoyladenosine biosynthesis protein TsaE
MAAGTPSPAPGMPMPGPIAVTLPDLAATGRLAARLAPLLRPGDALLLEGPLGAGKSAFARALLRALAGDPGMEVPSPSFTLVQSYELPGGLEAHHYDLYRLEGPGDLTELGWEEARRGLVIVEWPERLGGEWPEEALVVRMAYGAGEEERVATLSGWAGRLAVAGLEGR